MPIAPLIALLGLWPTLVQFGPPSLRGNGQTAAGLFLLDWSYSPTGHFLLDDSMGKLIAQ